MIGDFVCASSHKSMSLYLYNSHLKESYSIKTYWVNVILSLSKTPHFSVDLVTLLGAKLLYSVKVMGAVYNKSRSHTYIDR